MYLFKHYSWKCKFEIAPNTCGPNISFWHCGDYTHIHPMVKLGKNCHITVGTVFGNNGKGEESVIVGDNCLFGISCKIIGSVTIGNNVTIGANAVVTKDIPDNAIVGGVPAKIIKFKE